MSSEDDLAARREEYRTVGFDIADVAADPDHALGYATSVLAHAVTLRLTLMGWVHPERPLACRLGHHRFVTVHDNPENRRFTSHLCERCGFVKDDWRGGEQSVVESFAWGNAGGPR